MRPILSVNRLASLVGMPATRLHQIADKIEEHYRLEVLKQGHKIRHLKIPKGELKELQRRISRNILSPIALSESAHGGVRGRSPRTNANQHLGQKYVATCDARDFFPSVRHSVVYRMFRHRMGFGRGVASLLTRLVTFEAQLPQGAPTSTAVANLLLTMPVDEPLAQEARNDGVSYTRFVDDICLSGPNPAPLINHTARLLSRVGLRLHRKKAPLGSKSKLKIVPRYRPQEVTGLIVNSVAGPSVSKVRRDKIRLEIFQLGHLPDAHLRGKAITSVRGKIAHFRQFNPGAAKRMSHYLQSTLAKPEQAELAR